MSLADWLLRLAVRSAPRERSEWAEAMKAEFLTMKSRRLRWALGCLGVSLGWRLAKDGLYVALVCATLWFLSTDPLFFLWAETIPRAYLMIGLYPPLVYMMVFCCVLGAYRPQHLALTASLVVIVTSALGVYQLYVVMPAQFGDEQTGFWEFLQQMTINDARLLVGVSAEFGACLGGGLVGRAIARRVARKTA
jgi:hypothetical protein